MTPKISDSANLAVAINDIATIKEDVKEIKIKLETDYITKDTFDSLHEQVTLLRNIVYGLIGLVMIAFIGALIKLVFLQ
jgi:hypothetical protein